MLKLFQVESYILTENRIYLDYTLGSKTSTSIIKISKNGNLYFKHSCKSFIHSNNVAKLITTLIVTIGPIFLDINFI